MEFIQNLINAIGKEKFITFSNTEDFPELSNETLDILKNYGIPSDDKMYPFLTTDGVLRRFKKGFVQIGLDLIDQPFCINLQNGELVLYSKEGDRMKKTNSSIKKYLETHYVWDKYDNEIEALELYGDYWGNHQAYARKFREMLEEVEPDIMTYEIWYVQWHEKDLGVL